MTGRISTFLLVLAAAFATEQCSAFTSPQAPSFAVRQAAQPSPSARFVAEPADGVEDSFLEKITEPVTDLCILGLRLGTCSLMIHHGLDKIENVDGFSANVVAKFFGFLPGEPAFWTLSAAATQVVGAVLLSVGVFSRPVALSMLATMAVAVDFHLLNTGAEGFPFAIVKAHSYNYELAAMYVAVLAYFSAAGAGKLSFDEQVLGGELNFYESIIRGDAGKKE